MLDVNAYKTWVLPELLKIPAWEEYLTAFFNEVVTLQAYNMGVHYKDGLNGVEEALSFVDPTQWFLSKAYNPTVGERSEDLGGSFYLNYETLFFTQEGNARWVAQLNDIPESIEDIEVRIKYPDSIGFDWTFKFAYYEGTDAYFTIPDNLNKIVYNTSLRTFTTQFNLTNDTVSTIDYSGSRGTLYYSGLESGDSLSNATHGFVLDREYTITFDVRSITLTGSLILQVALGGEWVDLDIGSLSAPSTQTLTLTAEDYLLQFRVKDGQGNGKFKINNLKIIGQYTEGDMDDIKTVLARIINVDNASRDILERYRDSIAFPSIANLPEALLRQLIKGNLEFVSYHGTELSSVLFFYFLGYDVEFVHLYAHTGDYNSESFEYIQQRVDDTLVSDPNGVVYAQVAATAAAAYKVQLYAGHEVITGDYIDSISNPFNSGGLLVTRVDGNYVYFEEKGTFTKDEYLSLYRKYPYAVNPDPANYFKTSHLDVFFKKKFIDGVDIDFAVLGEYFVQYLPANVVIRNFGYREEPISEAFRIKEVLFRLTDTTLEEWTFTEDLTMPVDAFVYLVWSTANPTHLDVNGIPVDGYSYVTNGVDPVSGEIIYLGYPL